MSDDVKDLLSLAALHVKQDEQTHKLNSLEIAVAKMEIILSVSTKQSDAATENTQTELRRMNDNMSEYNLELREHIAGVNELKEQNRLIREEIKLKDSEINQRLKTAERPIEWIATTFVYLKWLGSAAAGAGLVWGVIQWLLKK
jgi:ABC-type multidrug transport system fused ATPase/permease subunit